MTHGLRQIWTGSLKARLSLALLLPFLVASVLIALVSTGILQRDMREEIEREQQSKAALLANSLEIQFTQRIDILNRLAVESAPMMEQGALAMDRWLAGQQGATMAFNRGVFITDASGVAIASWPPSAERLGLNYKDRDYIRSALDRGVTSVGKPVIGRPLGKPVLLIGAPVKDSQQRVVGVVVGVTDLGRASFLDSLFTAEDWTDVKAQFHLVDPVYRMVVASTDRQRAMETLPAAEESPGWHAVLSSESASVSLVDHGKTVLASSRPVGSLGWLLVLTVPAQDALAWTVASRNRILFSSAALAITSLAIALWFLGRQLRPLQQATAALRLQLASGSPNTPLPVNNPDEIGDLITAFNRMLRALLERENSLRIKDSALQSISQGILITGADRRIIAVNPSFSQITGYALDDLQGRDCRLLQGPQTDPDTVQRIRDSLAAGTHFTGEILNYRKNGDTFWNHLTITPVRDEAGTIVNFIGVTRDITERHLLEEQRRISATAFESQEGIFVTDVHQKILQVNRAFTSITGYTEAEAVGRTPRLLSSGRHDAAFYNTMREKLAQHGFWQGEIWNRRKSGELFPESLTITAVRDEHGVTSHFVANFIDIGARKDAEMLIHRLAHFDPLTNLPNRRQLEEVLSLCLNEALKSQRLGALLFMDLDNFKLLNDTRGHLVGDHLLRQVALRLRAAVREADTVARLGGDEFVVVLVGLDSNPDVAVAEAEAIGRKLLETFATPFALESGEFACTASIGVTLFGDRAESIEGPLKRADLSMYQAKSAGRNTLRCFDETVEEAVASRVSMEDRLRHAIKGRELFLNLQPQVHADGRVIGAEALLRWNDPVAGLVPPDRFIPLAEQSGLILQIGRWVAEEACALLARWQSDDRLQSLSLSINVSARQIQASDFVQQILDALQRHQVAGERLKLEITESVLLDHIDDTIAKMARLQQAGVRFSLDDFGTGYSSLSYLKRLPVEELKIDRSFVRDILVDANDAAIARLVLAMAATLGMRVMAEGVEEEAQLALLKSQGCQGFQGYLFSRPVSPDAFEQWVRSRHPL